MIPTVLFPALLVGRWWTLPLLVAGWIHLMWNVPGCGTDCMWATAGLSLGNAAAGVAIHKVVASVLSRALG